MIPERLQRGSKFVCRLTAGLVLLLVAAPGALQAKKTVGNPQCGGTSTVDLMGPKMAKEARDFLAEFQAAVQSGERDQIAGMISYPLLVLRSGRRGHIRGKQLFLASYDRILTPPVRDAIRKQSSECLFGNSMGAMIGNGEVWFRQQPDGKMKIITINETTAFPH